MDGLQGHVVCGLQVFMRGITFFLSYAQKVIYMYVYDSTCMYCIVFDERVK